LTPRKLTGDDELVLDVVDGFVISDLKERFAVPACPVCPGRLGRQAHRGFGCGGMFWARWGLTTKPSLKG